MKFKLIANTETVNILKNKYKISSFMFTKYIEVNYNDLYAIQELLDKQVIVNNTNNTITVLD